MRKIIVNSVRFKIIPDKLQPQETDPKSKHKIKELLPNDRHHFINNMAASGFKEFSS